MRLGAEMMEQRHKRHKQRAQEILATASYAVYEITCMVNDDCPALPEGLTPSLKLAEEALTNLRRELNK